MQRTWWELNDKGQLYNRIVSVIVYTFGDMQKNPHNARKHSLSLSVVNKNLDRWSKS